MITLSITVIIVNVLACVTILPYIIHYIDVVLFINLHSVWNRHGPADHA